MSDSVIEDNKKAYSSERVAIFDLNMTKTLNKVLVQYILEYQPKGRSEAIIDKALFIEGNEIDPDTDIQLTAQSDHWNKSSTKLLDFASGAGNITKYFSPYINEAIGLDISQDMINEYEKRTGFSGYAYNILEENSDSPVKDGQFDAIVCTMAYHHIEDIGAVTKRLSNKLKSGGWLYVMDFDATSERGNIHKLREAVISSDGHGHNHSHGTKSMKDLGVVHEHGLSPEGLVDLFEEAGLTDIGIDKHIDIRIWSSKSDLKQMMQIGDDTEVNTGAFLKDNQSRLDLTYGLLLAAGRKP